MCCPSETGDDKSGQFGQEEVNSNEFLPRLQASTNPFFIFAQRVIDDGGDETTAQPE